MHSAYFTSAVFGVVNALLLRARIRREEQALEEDNVYWEAFKDSSKMQWSDAPEDEMFTF